MVWWQMWWWGLSHCLEAFPTSSVADSLFTFIQWLTTEGKMPWFLTIIWSVLTNPFSTWQIHHFTVFLQRKVESKESSKATIFFKARRLGYYSILPASSFPFLLASVALPSVFEGGLVNSSQQETFWKWISLLSKQRSHYLPSKRGGGVTKLATMETLQLPSLQQLSLMLWHPLMWMLLCCISMHFCIRIYCCISAHCCVCFHCCICLTCLGLCICKQACDVSETNGSFVLLCGKWVCVCYIYVCVHWTCMHVIYITVYVGTHAVAREGLHMTNPILVPHHLHCWG